eukprot:jgi/Ulvmu1/6420/UM003_0049.1
MRLIGCLGLQLVTTLCLGTNAQFSTYPIAPIAQSTLPQDDLTKHPEGFCYCDVTAYSCDSNCCCDTVCDSTEVDLFATCLPMQPLTPELNFCISEDAVSTVSLPASGSLTVLKRKANGDSFTRSLFCIVDENNPNFGTFFEDPEPATAAILEEALNKLPDLPQEAPPGAEDIGTYRVGQSIPIGRQLNATITQNGVFSLPVDPYTGFCLDGGLPLGMGMDEPAASTDTAHRCIRVVAPAECVPSGGLSAQPLTAALYLAPRPGALPSVAPAVESARRPDGSAVALAAGGGLPEPLLDAAAGVCRDVALGVAYTVVTRSGDALAEDPGGQVAEVRADVIIGDVATVTADGRFVVQQAFSVKFRNIATAVDAIPISGSPGYRTGAMLLFGTAAADASGVLRRTAGMPLPSAAPLTGACTAPTDLAAPARFGVNAAAACGVPLTPAELRELCRGSGGVAALGVSAADGAAALLPRYSGLVPGALIGSWGSADPSDLAQWIAIDQETPDVSMAWDENTATCSRVPAGVRLDVLVSAVGAAANPQRRVALVRSRVMYRQWQHPWAGVRGDNATDAAFSFPLETVLRFVPQQQAQHDAVRRLPPLRMSLPEDFFYPFTSGDSP